MSTYAVGINLIKNCQKDRTVITSAGSRLAMVHEASPGRMEGRLAKCRWNADGTLKPNGIANADSMVELVALVAGAGAVVSSSMGVAVEKADGRASMMLEVRRCW